MPNSLNLEFQNSNRDVSLDTTQTFSSWPTIIGSTESDVVR